MFDEELGVNPPPEINPPLCDADVVCPVPLPLPPPLIPVDGNIPKL